MSTRIYSLLLLALGACGNGRTDATDNGRILCARGSAPLTRSCTVERDRRGGVLTIHAEDGGFRRLRVTDDGRGVVAADGAEAARVHIVDANTIDVTLGNNRYRLPATARGANAAP